MRTAKEIRNYLSQQLWYKEYIRNSKKFAKSYKMVETNYGKDIIRGYEKSRTICAAFIWSETMQGADIWVSINNKFIEWYNRGGNNYEKRRY